MYAYIAYPLLLISISLAGCELIDSQANIANDNSVIQPDISSAQLKQVESSAELELYLKNGLRLSNVTSNEYIDAEIATNEVLTAEAGSSATSGSSNDNFSSTNTQEIGVDEADRIEYDGEFLYIITNSNNYPVIYTMNEPVAIDGAADTALVPATLPPEKISPPGIRVMQRGTNASMHEIARLNIDNQNGFKGIYLNNNVLAAISMSYDPVQTLSFQNDIWYWGKPETRLDLMDVSAPAAINISHTIIMDGQLISSRRIDNKLILITRYTPQLTGFIPYPVSDEQKTENRQLIDSVTIDTLLPRIAINGDSKPLLSATDCYIPDDASDNTGYANLTIISIIDMTSPDQFNSSCFNSISHGIYASNQALYISSSTDNRTIIHKFSLDTDKPLYLGSGSVPGNLGWRNPSYRMSESGDILRVVSSLREASGELEHYLTILQDNKQGQLEQLSQLPNELHADKIGKPGESIQSVRYFQDRAYIVTFLQTDPLYVIDLSNAESPSILGELEIPGFSSYLHPVNENLLLGFGQQGWANTKMSLFDVSNPTEPREIKSFIWENTSTPLGWDPRALAFIEAATDHYRFSFPVESWIDLSSASELYMFDLLLDNEQISLSEPFRLPVTTDNIRGYAYGYNQRSLIQGDEVHYVYDDRVWSASWDLSIQNPAQ